MSNTTAKEPSTKSNYRLNAFVDATLWGGHLFGVVDTEKKRYALLTEPNKGIILSNVYAGKDERGNSQNLGNVVKGTFLENTIKGMRVEANVLIQGESEKDKNNNFGIISFELNKGDVEIEAVDGLDGLVINKANITFAYWGGGYENSDKILDELPKAIEEVTKKAKIESEKRQKQLEERKAKLINGTEEEKNEAQKEVDKEKIEKINKGISILRDSLDKTRLEEVNVVDKDVMEGVIKLYLTKENKAATITDIKHVENTSNTLVWLEGFNKINEDKIGTFTEENKKEIEADANTDKRKTDLNKFIIEKNMHNDIKKSLDYIKEIKEIEAVS